MLVSPNFGTWVFILLPWPTTKNGPGFPEPFPAEYLAVRQAASACSSRFSTPSTWKLFTTTSVT